ncbi:MAG: FAD-dependent oxidoreductase, partial [Deltaproteobacteria bacterium]|nr:FAD-dependent oxidoreductase [Deltaproteobacteria bacterium]
MISAQYVIIGAGFAGAATAYHLARRGVREIVVLEQESMAGVHSSGRNAAMVRQVVSDPAIAGLAREGAAFLRNLPADWPVPVSFQQNGSLLLGGGEGWKKISH